MPEGEGHKEQSLTGTTPAVPEAEPLETEDKKKPKRLGLIHQWIASFILTVAYLIIGSSVGWASPTLYRIEQTGVPFNLTSVDESVMVASLYVGNMVMPVPAGLLSDYVGRKTSLLIADILPFTSWLLIYFATGPVMIHIARLLIGMWGGQTLAVVPLYLGEVADPKIRGALSTLAQIMINSGELLAYTLGQEVSYWSLAFIFGTFPVLLFALLFIIPESPHWLIYKRTEEKTAESLAWYNGKTKDEVQDQVEEMSFLKADMNTRKGGFKALVKSKGNIKALIIVLVLVISQRACGISAIMAYSTITLPNKKVWGLMPNDCMIIFGVFWLITCVCVIFLVDRLGRIPLLLMSCAGCGVSMLTACVWYALNDESPESSSTPWVPFVAFFIYGLAFNLGLGPLPTTVQGEMFAPKLKAVASGISAMVCSATSAIVIGVYLTIAERHGVYVNYLIYALVSFGTGFFGFFYMIETKGKSLNEIQLKLNS